MTIHVNKRTYGWLIEKEDRFGTEYLVARAVCRENNELHPLNCRNDGESTIWDAPKKLDGFLLDGLELASWISDIDGRPVHADLSFRNTYSINMRTAKAALKTLRKAHKAIDKAEAWEPADAAYAVGKALGFTFTVERKGPPGGSYPASKWTFTSLEAGRNSFRKLSRELETGRKETA
jgi:hypothetical protein